MSPFPYNTTTRQLQAKRDAARVNKKSLGKELVGASRGEKKKIRTMFEADDTT